MNTQKHWALNRGRIVEVLDDGNEGRVVVTLPVAQCVADEQNHALIASAPDLLRERDELRAALAEIASMTGKPQMTTEADLIRSINQIAALAKGEKVQS